MDLAEEKQSKTDYSSLFTGRYWIVIMALISSVLWGSAFPVLKVSYAELGMAADDFIAKIVLAGMRFFLASLMLFGMVLLSRQSLRVEKKLIWELILLGILHTSLQYFFFYNGLAHITGMKGAVLQSSSTFFIVVLAHYFYVNDRLNWKKAFGLAAGFGGIIMVNSGRSLNLDFTWLGEGFLLIAALVGAFGTILAKRLSKSVNPMLLTGWQMFFGSILLIGYGMPLLQPGAMVFTTKAWLLLLYSAFLSAAAFSLWYSLLKYNKAGEISIYQFMIPVSGAVLSAGLIPGERLNLLMAGAILLVSLGIVVVNHRH